MTEEKATAYSESGLQSFTIEPGKEAEAWAKVKAICPHLTKWGIKTLRDGLDAVARTIIVEPRYICRDYRDLYSQFYSKKFVERPSWCHRLHFFVESNITDDVLVLRGDEPLVQKSYIGYSVIQPIRTHCIGRTVLDPRKLGINHHVLKTPMRVRVNGVELHVEGYPYMSQSGEPTICAHAAMWGICRYLSERYPAYAEVHPYDLIEMTGSTRGRRVPYRGMTYEDYCQILSSFGCHPVFVRPKGTTQTDWTKDREAFYNIYSYVESGFPVMASFVRHAASLVGHTLSKTMVDTRKEYGDFYNSFCLVPNFVVVDDNFFPYRLLGHAGHADNYGEKFQEPPKPSIDSIYGAVVPLPEKAYMPPDRARKLSYVYFSMPDVQFVLAKVQKELGIKPDDPMIARSFLTSSIAFKARKRLHLIGGSKQTPDKLAGLPVGLNLPHFIWVMELRPLSCYNDGQCLAEVVLDASANADECEYIYLRVGRTVLRGDKLAEPDPGALLKYPQYTHNLGERV